MKNYYGFEYADGVNTTTGQPNNGFERFHGRLSIAGKAVVFNTIKERNLWIDRKCNSCGGRIAVNRSQLRRLCAGYNNEEFSLLLSMMEIDKQY